MIYHGNLQPEMSAVTLLDGRVIYVISDAATPGGTKELAAGRWFPNLAADEVVYAGPRHGYAQIAVARGGGGLREAGDVVRGGLQGGT